MDRLGVIFAVGGVGKTAEAYLGRVAAACDVARATKLVTQGKGCSEACYERSQNVAMLKLTMNANGEIA